MFSGLSFKFPLSCRFSPWWIAKQEDPSFCFYFCNNGLWWSVWVWAPYLVQFTNGKWFTWVNVKAGSRLEQVQVDALKRLPWKQRQPECPNACVNWYFSCRWSLPHVLTRRIRRAVSPRLSRQKMPVLITSWNSNPIAFLFKILIQKISVWHR